MFPSILSFLISFFIRIRSSKDKSKELSRPSTDSSSLRVIFRWPPPAVLSFVFRLVYLNLDPFPRVKAASYFCTFLFSSVYSLTVPKTKFRETLAYRSTSSLLSHIIKRGIINIWNYLFFKIKHSIFYTTRKILFSLLKSIYQTFIKHQPLQLIFKHLS